MGIRYAHHWHYLCHSPGADVLWRYPILSVPVPRPILFANLLTSLGCWITSHYPSQRIGLEYLWMWIAALVVTVVYIFLALVVKGFVSVDGGRIRITIGQKRVHRDLTASHDGGAGRDGTSIAICLLFYPAVYIITVSPKRPHGALSTDGFRRSSLLPSPVLSRSPILTRMFHLLSRYSQMCYLRFRGSSMSSF